MACKAVLFCAFAVFVQLSLAGPYYLPKSSNCGCGSGKVNVKEIEKIEEISYKPIAIAPKSYSSNCVSIEIPNNGGALVISSIGPIAPSGIAVATELGLAGDLELSGELPYLSAVEFQGQFATSGAVPVAYGCGDCVAITEQIGGSVGSGSYSLSSLGRCGCKY
ncbi:chorion class CB protein M5H4-like [Cydia pomonella]|uniref:chorion class CB protein M5H4-like n=1 Tax=Cydia pomonella TaxID=82600 RepID=UPI002ADD4931|nr:chorion class CB protein M5H4-like [Cydia pomonella]